MNCGVNFMGHLKAEWNGGRHDWRGGRRLPMEGERGMSLVEVVVAAAIIFLALIPMLQSFVLGGRYGEESRRIITALHLAQGKLEDLKNRPYSAVVNEPAYPDFADPGRSVAFSGRPGYAYQVMVEEGQYNIKEVKLAVFYNDAGITRQFFLTMDKVRR